MIDCAGEVTMRRCGPLNNPLIILLAALSTGCYQWAVVNDDVFERGEMWALAQNDKVLVAVGLDYASYGMGHDENAAAWYSNDGRGWHLAFFGNKAQYYNNFRGPGLQ